MSESRESDAMKCTVDVNAEPRFLTLKQVREREEAHIEEWELRNDMVKSIEVWSCDYGFLQLRLFYKSDTQDVGGGYRSEGNIGVMILWLARLWDLYGTNGDLLKGFKGIPIRVMFRFRAGESVADNTYLGHFMKDRFIKASDLMQAGICKEAGEA